MKRALGLTHLALSQSRVQAVRVRVARVGVWGQAVWKVRVWGQAVWKGRYSLSNVGIPLRRVVTLTASCSFPAHFPYCTVRARGRVRPVRAALDAHPVLQPCTVMRAHRAWLQNCSVAEPILRAHRTVCARITGARLNPKKRFCASLSRHRLCHSRSTADSPAQTPKRRFISFRSGWSKGTAHACTNTTTLRLSLHNNTLLVTLSRRSCTSAPACVSNDTPATTDTREPVSMELHVLAHRCLAVIARYEDHFHLLCTTVVEVIVKVLQDRCKLLARWTPGSK